MTRIFTYITHDAAILHAEASRIPLLVEAYYLFRDVIGHIGHARYLMQEGLMTYFATPRQPLISAFIFNRHYQMPI